MVRSGSVDEIRPEVGNPVGFDVSLRHDRHGHYVQLAAPVWLKAGHCGRFVTHRRNYALLPKDIPAGALTLAPLGKPGGADGAAEAAGHGARVASGRRMR